MSTYTRRPSVKIKAIEEKLGHPIEVILQAMLAKDYTRGEAAKKLKLSGSYIGYLCLKHGIDLRRGMPGRQFSEEDRAKAAEARKNKLVTLGEESLTVAQWAEKFGVTQPAFRWRLKNWTEEEIIAGKPVRK